MRAPKYGELQVVKNREAGELWRERMDEPQPLECFGLASDFVAESSEEVAIRGQLYGALWEAVGANLKKRECQVLVSRYVHDLTLDEVGQIIGVTRERIRQIEAKAIRKLKHPSCVNKLLAAGFDDGGRRDRLWSYSARTVVAPTEVAAPSVPELPKPREWVAMTKEQVRAIVEDMERRIRALDTVA